MSVIKLSEKDNTRSEWLLTLAEDQLEGAIEDLAVQRDEIRKGNIVPETDLRPVMTNLRKAIQTLYDERSRFDDLRKRQAGIVHDFALDLDSARAEVGRLLDRLRGAHVSGGMAG